MPRQNRNRSIASEANLAERISFEREQRRLSYEGLAKLMTDQGCSIQGSAIYRIEKGDPPRRVTVDELVALSNVLKADLEDLLRPIGAVHQERADEVAAEFETALDDLTVAASRVLELLVEWKDLAAVDDELSPYIVNRIEAARPSVSKGPRTAPSVVPAAIAERLRVADVRAIESALADLINAMSGALMRGGK